MQHRTQSTADRIVRLVERLYLDLFAWIQLTRARLGRPGSEPHVRAYQALRAAVTAERVVVPLSSMQLHGASKREEPTPARGGRPHDGRAIELRDADAPRGPNRL